MFNISFGVGACYKEGPLHAQKNLGKDCTEHNGMLGATWKQSHTVLEAIMKIN